MEYKSFFSANMSTNNTSSRSSAVKESNYIERKDRDSLEKELNDFSWIEGNLDYIERTSELMTKEKREELIYSESNDMPEWAEQLADKNGTRASLEFFLASEKHEPFQGKKRITFRELEIPLPQEFTLEQNIELTKEILNRLEISGRPLTICIHSKDAQLSPENKNIHAHVMFSDRIPDGHNRSAEQYFKQYRPKNPENGGCPKDKRFSQRDSEERSIALVEAIKIIEVAINEHYLKNGYDYFVHSGTKSQLKELAIKLGDERLKEIADVSAQKHLGEQKSRNLNNPDTKIVMEQKAEVRAINDKYIIQELEKENAKSEIDLKILSVILKANGHTEEQIKNILSSNKEQQSENLIPTTDNELNKLSDSLDRQIADIKLKFYTPEDSARIESELKTKESLESQIKSKSKTITKDTRQAAVREHCRQTNCYDEFVLNRSDTRNLEWHKNKIIENEARIIAKHFQRENTASNILLETMLANQNFKIDAYSIANKYDKKKLDSLKRKAESLEKDVTDFDNKYVKPHESEIENLEKNVIQRNDNLANKIGKLQSELTELDKKKKENNPLLIELQEIKTNIENKMIEITNLRTERFKFLSKSVPNNLEIATLLKKSIKSIDEISAVHESIKAEIEQLKSDPLTTAKDGMFFKNKEKSAHLDKIAQAESRLIPAENKWNIILANAKVAKENLYVESGKSIQTKISEVTALQSRITKIEKELVAPEIKIPEPSIDMNQEIKKTTTKSYIPTLRSKIEQFKNVADEYKHHFQQFTKSTGETKSNPLLDIKITNVLLRQGYPKEVVVKAIQQNSNAQGKPDSGYGAAIMTRSAGSDIATTRNSANKLLTGMASQQPDGCTAVALSANLNSSGQLDLSGKTQDQIKLAISELGISGDR